MPSGQRLVIVLLEFVLRVRMTDGGACSAWLLMRRLALHPLANHIIFEGAYEGPYSNSGHTTSSQEESE